MKTLALLMMIVSTCAFAKNTKDHKSKDMGRHVASASACGDIDDGLSSAEDLAKWKPEKLKGDMNNWYFNSNTRVRAALLKAKLATQTDLSEAQKGQLQKEIAGACQALD